MTSVVIWISDLGHGPFYLAIAVLCMVLGGVHRLRLPHAQHDVFWMGWRLTLFWVMGVLLNTSLKYWIRAPRPWWIDSELIPLHPHPAGGFGMPSGHTQSAVGLLLGLWGLGQIMRQRKGRGSKAYLWLNLLGILWVFGIAYSRVALHAHSLAQVVAGGLFGILWATLILWAERSRSGVRVLISLSILFTFVGVWLTHYTPELPQEWTQVILAYQVKPLSAPSLTQILTAGGISLLWSSLLNLKHRN